MQRNVSERKRLLRLRQRCNALANANQVFDNNIVVRKWPRRLRQYIQGGRDVNDALAFDDA
jgi:hypothetical protein